MPAASADMDTSTPFVKPAAKKRGTTSSTLRKDSKLHKSTDSLDTSNRYDSLSDDDEGDVVPQTRPPTPPQQQASQQNSSSTVTPPVKKRERVPTITIKWAVSRVQADIRVSNMKSSSFFLKQIHGGTVVKVATLSEYESTLHRTSGATFHTRHR
jgi:hypothetical protein